MVKTGARRRLVKLVGMFKSLSDPSAGGGAALGGYADSFAEGPYSLANAYLKSYCDAIPRVRSRNELRLVNLQDRTDAGRGSEEFRLSPQDIAILSEGAPAAVCFSSYCWNSEAVLEACRGLKALLPETKTVVGGRAAGGSPVRVLDENPAVDFVVSGEGETPFSSLLLCDFAPSGLVGGLSYRTADGRAVAAAPAEPIRDLDSIPSPYERGIVSPPADGMLMELSRGCLYACGYCDWNAAKPRRHFSAGRIGSDLEWALSRGIRHITLVDSAINYETERLREFVSVLGRIDPGRTLSFSYNLRHEYVNEEQAELLGGIVPRQVLLGLETLNDGALENSGRARFDARRFERALRLTSEVAPPLVGVVLGLPGDTAEGFVATMEYLGRLSREQGTKPLIGAVLVSLLQVFQGTRLYEERSRFGLNIRTRGIPYLTSSASFSFEDLQSCVRYLQRFRFRHPVVVKGPEGLSVLTGENGPDLLRENVRNLLNPWEQGTERDGWRFEKALPISDGEGFGVYAFRRMGSADAVEIRLDRRDTSKSCLSRSTFFNIHCRERVPGEDAAARLRDIVLGLVRENEGWVVGL